MGFPNSENIIAASRSRLARAGYSPTRLAFYHIGLTTALNLVLLVVDKLLSLQIADTGGLGGMGLRSTLESVEMVLQLGLLAFVVFWDMSYLHLTLRWARGQEAGPTDLMEGLRRFGPVLRGYLLKTVIAVVVFMVVMQLSSILYAFTPMSDSVTDMLMRMMTDPDFVPDEAALMDFYMVYLPVMLLVAAVLGIPIAYRLRMMDFALMDEPKTGAFSALRTSIFMMRGNCKKLLMLDLRFWWFYLLQVLAVGITYLDMILAAAGVQTGMDSQTLFYLCGIVGLAFQVVLMTFGRNVVYTSYASVYESLKPRPERELAGPADL